MSRSFPPLHPGKAAPRSRGPVLRRLLGALILVLQPLAAGDVDNLPIVDLEDFAVIYSATDFAPAFSREVPSFSFFETPKLPKAELIHALHFVDRYREARVPGPVKWIGILHFPVLDGYERVHLKWICLYVYDGRLFGYDPSALSEQQRRFIVPIRYEDRLNPRVLARFANSYVGSVFAAGAEDWTGDDFDDPDDADGGFGSSSFENEIPASRIAPVYASQRGVPLDELVRMVYQFIEDPNPDPAETGEIGRQHPAPRTNLNLRSLLSELTTTPDHLETARQLLAPRWSQRVVFHYTRRPFFFVSRAATEEALIFNVSTQIFAYHPQFGVWRTDATVHDLSDPKRFLSRLRIPDIREVKRVEFVPLAKP
ncbi:MAG: hypothetical protein JJT96_04610 [Opitutales bacterium]|nr:hypothetical protein [Opitutales bacterium]